MATAPMIGTVSDARRRLKALVPASWFKDPTIDIDALLYGFATEDAFIYSLAQFAKAQTRLQSASGGFLDLTAYDYFGLAFVRNPGQSDVSFSKAILNQLLLPKVTRQGLVDAVQAVTGNSATVFEPFNAADTRGLGSWALNEPSSKLGSLSLPFTVLIDAVEPGGGGVPNLSGLNCSYGGLGSGAFALADLTSVAGSVPNSAIYAAVNAARAAGITAFVRIGSPLIGGGRLGSTFYLDSTLLA